MRTQFPDFIDQPWLLYNKCMAFFLLAGDLSSLASS